MLTFFKALADENRLRIVGLLANEPRTGEQLAAMLGIRPSTVSHHLAKLQKAGLVHATAEGHYSVYHLRADAVRQAAERLLASETLPLVAAGVDTDAYDRKVLSTFLNADGTVSKMPMQRKKRDVILRHLVKEFEPGRRYSEREVTDLLFRFYRDPATLRREMVDIGLMDREGGGGAYWRTGEIS
jgi:biotin operon repressor